MERWVWTVVLKHRKALGLISLPNITAHWPNTAPNIEQLSNIWSDLG